MFVNIKWFTEHFNELSLFCMLAQLLGVFLCIMPNHLETE
nr:MAG TPA: hypothetical protein [Caudoviricetes sp.]